MESAGSALVKQPLPRAVGRVMCVASVNGRSADISKKQPAKPRLLGERAHVARLLDLLADPHDGLIAQVDLLRAEGASQFDRVGPRTLWSAELIERAGQVQTQIRAGRVRLARAKRAQIIVATSAPLSR